MTPKSKLSDRRKKAGGTGNPAVTNITVFILLLSAGALLSFVLPKTKISEIEKRELTKLPAFSWEQLFEGNYTDSLDLFYADNFPFREPFVDLSGILNQNFGYRTNDLRIYTTQGSPEESSAIIPPAMMDSLNVMPDDSLVSMKTVQIDSAKSKASVFNSILIYQGRAFQLFRGSTENARLYAEMINQYHTVLGDSIRIFCLIAPSPIDFYLPPSNKMVGNLERPNIEVVYANLDSGVAVADAYDEIEKHKNEYLYFNTDHHWTARGAYYAYRSFCTAASLEAYDLSKFERRIRKKYLGSLYDMTKDLRLKENQDSVESFRLPFPTKTWRYATAALDSPVYSRLFVETGTYTVFLGGDFPLVHIKTEIKNDRRALIIKDSYGNAVAPYLAMHYQEVYVIDYRYFEKNILSFIKKNKITDLIFLHNTFVVNTRYTVQRELYLMGVRDKLPERSTEDSVKSAVPKINSERKNLMH